MATPFISVILLGIMWNRINYRGALAGLIGGVVIQLLLVFSFYVTAINVHWLYIGAIAQALTMILIVLVSLCTPAPDPEKVNLFVWHRSWLRIFDNGDRPWWQGIKFWLFCMP